MKRGLLAALALTAGLAGCGSANVAYIPSAWGPSGYCYYLYSPYECYGHHYGTPTLMPLYWHERYAPYYDSPAYTQVYVPSRYRSTATSRAQAFERTYSSQISSATRAATWRGSNGKTVPGTKVGRSATFGSGSARSTGFATGSFRRGSSSSGNPCASLPNHILLASVLYVRGGSSGGGGHSGGISSSGAARGAISGGRIGGGSARSGGSVGSRSGTRSGHNC